MSAQTRRATRRNLATQPIPRGQPKPAKVKHAPISPDELAQIIAAAREQRTEEDIRSYSTKEKTA